MGAGIIKTIPEVAAPIAKTALSWGKQRFPKLASGETSGFLRGLVPDAWSTLSPIKKAMPGTYEKLKLYLGADTKIAQELRYGIVKATDTGPIPLDARPSMEHVLEPLIKYPKTTSQSYAAHLKGDLNDITVEYLQAKTGLEDARKFGTGYKWAEEWDNKRANSVINNIENVLKNEDVAAYGAVKEAEKRFGAFFDFELESRLASELIGPNDIAAIKAARESYFPLFRNTDSLVDDAFDVMTGNFSALKRREAGGSVRALLDNPVEAAKKRYIAGRMLGERNIALNTAVDEMLENPELSKLIRLEKTISPGTARRYDYGMGKKGIGEFVSEHKELKPNQFLVRRIGTNGSSETYTVSIADDIIYKALVGSPPRDMGSLMQAIDFVATNTAKVKRAGIVFTPTFFLRSLAKALGQSAIHAPYSKSYKELGGIKSKEFWKDAFVPFSYGENIVGTFKAAGNILKTHGAKISNKTTIGQQALDFVADPTKVRWDLMETMFLQYGGGGMVGESASAVAENAVRSAVAERVFWSSIKRGMNADDAARKAAMARRNLGGDYKERGEFARKYGRWIPFFNATIAGTRDMAEAIARNPLGFSLKMVQLSVIPTIARFYLNKDNPEYQAMPASQRVTRAYITPNFWLPRSYAIPGFVSFFVEERLRELYRLNPTDANALGQAALSYMVANPIPPLAEIYFFTKQNKDMFTGRQIVSEYEKQKPKFMQSEPSTSEFAKSIGQATRKLPDALQASPAMVDAYLRNIGGTLAQTGGKLIGRGIVSAKGGVMPDPFFSVQNVFNFPEVVPFVSRKPTEASSDYMQRFYKYSDEAKRAQIEYDTYLEEGNDFEAFRVFSDKGKLLTYNKWIDKSRKQIATLREQYNEIRDPNNTTMSPEEKRKWMDFLMRQMNEVARNLVVQLERSE